MPIIGSPTTDDPDDDPTQVQPAPTASVGDGQPSRTGRTDPLPAPEFPEINTSNFERPERDTDARRRLALLQLAGAAGSLFGAAGDSSMLTSIGAGLAQAGRRGVQSIDEQFRAEQEAYQKFLQDAREFNRQSRLAEAEATARRNRARRERRFTRTQNRLDRELDRELDQPTELEQEIDRARKERIEAQTATERREAVTEQEQAETERARQQELRSEAEANRRGPEPQSAFDDLPDDPARLRSLRSQLEAQAEALRNEMPTGFTGFGPNREPSQPVLRRQLSERIATKRAQMAAIDAKLSEVEAGGGREPQSGRRQGGGRGGQQGRQQTIPEEDLMENRTTVFNRGAAAAPGSATRQAGSQTDQQADRQDADQDQGQQAQLTDRQVRGLVQRAPDSTTASVRELRRAAEQVLSDTTNFTPADFERAYGFNPFSTDSVATQR